MAPVFPSTTLLLNEDDLEQYILLTLGAPQVKVELVAEDLRMAINEAKRWFNAKKGVSRLVPLTVSPGQTEYPLPDNVDTVTEFIFPGKLNNFARFVDPMVLIDGALPYNVFQSPASAGFFSSYVQMVGYLDSAQRITGSEPEWFQENRTLYLLPAPPAAGTGFIRSKMNDFVLTQLSERDHDLVKRYALAWARRKLGEVRRKYMSGFPGAQGTVTLNGDALYAEGMQEMAQLADELSESGYPMGFVVG